MSVKCKFSTLQGGSTHINPSCTYMNTPNIQSCHQNTPNTSSRHHQCTNWCRQCMRYLCVSEVFSVYMCLWAYLDAHPLQDGEFILFWHNPEKARFFFNLPYWDIIITKCPYILNINDWVFAIFSLLVPVTF